MTPASHTSSARPLVRLVRVAFLVFSLCLPSLSSAQPLVFTRSVVLSHHVGEFCWSPIPSASHYSLFRQFPGQDTFSLVATVADTHYVDTLRRTLCADTVNYFLTASIPTTTLLSDTVGLFFQDNLPTSPCALRLCSVDTATGRLHLSWYPSPDTDVLGYYICMGNPCLDFDTVWGRLNTSYLCPDSLSPLLQHSFRILAFDSCFQASQLTPFFHNPVLRFSDTPCSRHLHLSWNRYIHMPDSVGRYSLYYCLQDQADTHLFRSGPDGPFEFDTLIPDLSISRVTLFLRVDNLPDSLHAFSARYTYHYSYGDTARYLRIASALYDTNNASVALSFDLDPLFPAAHCHLYRRQPPQDTFALVATLPLSSPPPSTLTYVDRSFNPSAGSCTYRLALPDLCQQRLQFSDSVTLLLPPVTSPAAYFPNAIIYGHPQLGSFCPRYASALGRDYRLDIFNRYGERVFHTTHIGDCWLGTTPDGRPLPQATYVYRARVCHADGTTQTYTGTVLLFR